VTEGVAESYAKSSADVCRLGERGMATVVKISASAVPIDRIQYNDQGLVPAIVQDYLDGTVLMMAWMNAESLAKTLEIASGVLA
jgi:phosphoribosyl-AMP cyclohydrolase